MTKPASSKPKPVERITKPAPSTPKPLESKRAYGGTVTRVFIESSKLPTDAAGPLP
jgi:hypothetical protein